MRLRLASLLLLAACNAGGEQPLRALPGPCIAHWGDHELTFEYDAEGRLSRAAMVKDIEEDDFNRDPTWRLSVVYDSSGAIRDVGWGETTSFGDEDRSGRWSFDEDGSSEADVSDIITNTAGSFSYEPGVAFPGMFAFWPPEMFAPENNDHRVEATTEVRTVTYTYDNPADELTRTRTGSDGSVHVFEYDVDGRLLRDPVLDRDYTWEDGRLVEMTTGSNVDTFVYDDFGNVLVADEGEPTEIRYGYGCW
jgi:hypothetical protein